MKMTWWVWEDHIGRIIPFLQKVSMGGKIETADTDALIAPLKPKPYKP